MGRGRLSSHTGPLLHCVSLSTQSPGLGSDPALHPDSPGSHFLSLGISFPPCKGTCNWTAPQGCHGASVGPGPGRASSQDAPEGAATLRPSSQAGRASPLRKNPLATLWFPARGRVAAGAGVPGPAWGGGSLIHTCRLLLHRPEERVQGQLPDRQAGRPVRTAAQGRRGGPPSAAGAWTWVWPRVQKRCSLCSGPWLPST